MIASIFSSIIYVVLNSLSIWLIGTMLGNIMSGDPSSIQSPSNLNEQLNFSYSKSNWKRNAIRAN